MQNSLTLGQCCPSHPLDLERQGRKTEELQPLRKTGLDVAKDFPDCSVPMSYLCTLKRMLLSVGIRKANPIQTIRKTYSLTNK